MFDFKGFRDAGYIRLKCEFNAIQLGFKLHPYTVGRFDPKNQKKYQEATNCDYSEFFALKCHGWMKIKKN